MTAPPGRPALPRLTLIRRTVRISHADPVNRTLEIELALRNDGEGEAVDFLFVLDEDLPGLAVRDGHGRLLACLPREEMACALASEGGSVDDFVQALVAPASRTERMRLVWVLFEARLRPGDTAILRLLHEDRRTPKEGPWLHKSPWFPLEMPPAHQQLEALVQVQAPAGSRLQVRERRPGRRRPGRRRPPVEASGPSDPASPPSPDFLIEEPRFLQIRRERGAPSASLEYRLRPLASEVALNRVLYGLLLAIPLVLLGAHAAPAGLLPWRIPFTSLEARSPGDAYAMMISAIAIPAMIGVMSLLRPVWVNRGWYLLPLALFLVRLTIVGDDA